MQGDVDRKKSSFFPQSYARHVKLSKLVSLERKVRGFPQF